MPDPLMGFSLQSVAPPVQPFAVSGAVALLSLERISSRPERPAAVASTEVPRRAIGRPFGLAVEAPPAFRALLRTRVRHLETVV
jgi:hypothetical protein